MTDTPNETPPIPFSFFASLLREIAKIKPYSAKTKGKKTDHRVRQTFVRWTAELRERYSPLRDDTAPVIFRLLFPEDDIQRKYDLNETRLAQVLGTIFGVSEVARGRRLRDWDASDGLGCLGAEVESVLASASTMDADASTCSIHDIDTLLDELAALSPFTHQSIRSRYPPGRRRSRSSILTSLYTLPPADAAYLTQIILKDMRPLLYPLACTNYTASLTEFKSNAVRMLTKEDAMMVWDASGRTLHAYRLRGSFDAAAFAADTHTADGAAHGPLVPVLGSPIQIPKCVKGQGCAQALGLFRGSKRVWAETKYDGERTQIHVKVEPDGRSHITIFSKSRRDSTHDRFAVHWIIREALGLPHHPTSERVDTAINSKIGCEVILEAEMVAFSQTLNRIDEFWRIRSLVESTAHGIRGRRHISGVRPDAASSELASQCSLTSNASDEGSRHLALVFFDILLCDAASLLGTPYAARRALLEDVVRPVPGRAMLAARTAIEMREPGRAAADLRGVFARLVADHQEGAVLKADEGAYNVCRSPWVKLKKDYIPGYGDALDLVLVGARWDKDRGRELRVAPETYTTFCLGAVANGDATKSDPSRRPHVDAWFEASYGLSREQLEELNFMIRSSDTVPYSSSASFARTEYDCSLFSGIQAPSVVLRTPLLAEVFGAGFTKAPKSTHYELRFPRITKVFRPSEHAWTGGVDVQTLHGIARASVGRDRTHKDVDDWCNGLWGKPASPSVKSAQKRRESEALWRERLERVDAKRRKKGGECALADRSPVRTTKALQLPKARTGLRPLGSLTNLSQTSALHGGQTANQQLPSSVSAIALSGRSAMKQTAGPTIVLTEPETRGCAFDDVADSPPWPTPPLSSPQPVQEKLALTSEDNSYSSAMSITTPNLASSSPYVVSSLMNGALVWSARPSGSLRPPWRSMLRSLIPSDRRVHGLESFLIGCGWDVAGGGALEGIERGIIFVDMDEGQWKADTLPTLEARADDLRKSGVGGCKPISLVDARSFARQVSLGSQDVGPTLICSLHV